jgi:ATP-binding cassette, subfamily B, bacterial MsbA
MSELVLDIKQIIFFMKKTGIRFRFFSVSIIFSLGLILINVYTISLLFPLSKGVIENNFEHVKDQFFIGSIIENFPDLFSNSIRIFIFLVIWIYFVIILKNILQYLNTISTDFQARQAVFSLRKQMLNKYLSFGKLFSDENNKYVIQSILLKSSNVVEKQFTLFKNLIVQSLLFCVFLLIMFYISWLLTLISLIIFPIMAILIKISSKKIRDYIKDSEKAEENLANKLADLLNGVSLIKSFVKEDYEKNIFDNISQDEISKNFKAKKLSSLLPSIEDIGATTTMLLLAFGIALTIYLFGGIDPSKAFVFIYLAQKMSPALNSFNNFRFGMMNIKRDVEQINKIMVNNDEYFVYDGNQKFQNLKEGIEFKNLTFKYRENKKPVLSDLNMYIEKGKVTAIVGPIGSGKSTIVSLLLRFYEIDSDKIIIDGVDIKNFKISSLRNRIAFISQEPTFFNDTILKNISYGKNKKINKNDIYNICKKVRIDHYIQKLPKKYETMIKEKGANLSGGQKQKLAIARAIIRDFDLLILDEATSAMDSIAENDVINAIREISVEKTTIVISHRLSTIKKADKIVFIKSGTVTESGTLDELINLKGDFYRNWQLQQLENLH